MMNFLQRDRVTGAFNPWLIAPTVMLATFMEVLDTSVANVSLQHIAGNLSATVEESTWVLTSYLVSNAIVLPLTGWFSKLFGRKRFYMACVVIFTLRLSRIQRNRMIYRSHLTAKPRMVTVVTLAGSLSSRFFLY